VTIFADSIPNAATHHGSLTTLGKYCSTVVGMFYAGIYNISMAVYRAICRAL